MQVMKIIICILEELLELCCYILEHPDHSAFLKILKGAWLANWKAHSLKHFIFILKDSIIIDIETRSYPIAQWANDVILTFYLCQNKVTVRFDVFLMSN